tara:strand:+ start:24189 stop:24389 length:201 start_codon:yes stop_codon:yes gene_type:complete
MIITNTTILQIKDDELKDAILAYICNSVCDTVLHNELRKNKYDKRWRIGYDIYRKHWEITITDEDM